MGTEENVYKRLNYIDYLETAAIFCVVCCHYVEIIGNGAGANIFMLFVKCFGVPVFFLANGVLMFQQKFSLKKHLKKTILLIVTTAAWKACYLIFQYIKLLENNNGWSKMDIWNYFCGGNLSDPYVPAEHFWFMYALIGVYLLFPLFMAIYKEKKVYFYYMVLLFFFVSVITEINAFSADFMDGRFSVSVLRESYFPFAQGGYYLLIFLMGPLLHKHFYQTNKNWKHRFVLLGIAAGGFLILVCESYFQNGILAGQANALSGDYQRIGTLLMAGSLFSLFATIEWKGKKISSVMEFLSARTIGIYAAHMIISYYFTYWFMERVAGTGIHMLIIKSFIVMVLALIFTECISYIPIIRDLLGLKYYKMRKGYLKRNEKF